MAQRRKKWCDLHISPLWHHLDEPFSASRRETFPPPQARSPANPRPPSSRRTAGSLKETAAGRGARSLRLRRNPVPPPQAAGLRVACIPLQAMVDAAGLLDLNLLSLDVEGGELTALRTLDLHATNVQVGGPRLGSRR